MRRIPPTERALALTVLQITTPSSALHLVWERGASTTKVLKPKSRPTFGNLPEFVAWLFYFQCKIICAVYWNKPRLDSVLFYFNAFLLLQRDPDLVKRGIPYF